MPDLAAPQPLRVLLVEDNPADAELILGAALQLFLSLLLLALVLRRDDAS